MLMTSLIAIWFLLNIFIPNYWLYLNKVLNNILQVAIFHGIHQIWNESTSKIISLKKVALVTPNLLTD